MERNQFGKTNPPHVKPSVFFIGVCAYEPLQCKDVKFSLFFLLPLKRWQDTGDLTFSCVKVSKSHSADPHAN